MPKRITIKVLPRSSRNMIDGPLEDGSYRVKITAAPVDGEANKKVIAFLSKEWNIPKSKITIVKGETSKDKIIEIPD